jgi:hypothetical protein
LNIVSWCRNTVFADPDKGWKCNPSLSLSIPLEHLQVYHLSSTDGYISSPEKFIYPFLLEHVQRILPSIVMVFKDPPPLWALSRLALGNPGVVPGGLGLDPESSRGRIPNYLWEVHCVQLTNPL